MRANFTVELACVALSVFAACSSAEAKTQPSDVGQSAPAKGLMSLPVSMQSGISATLGREDSRYLVNAVDNGFHGNNPVQHLSVEFTPAGANITQGAANWSMSLRSYGYGNRLAPVESASIGGKENRVEYRRGAVTEWYVNGPVGLEQGFTFARRTGTSNGAPLTLKIALSGNVTPQIEAGSNTLMLAQNDTRAQRYSGLTAVGAKGNSLKSWMELRGGDLLLHVDDHAAQYPLTVDPFVQKAVFSSSDSVAGDEFGFSVALNNDYAVVGSVFANVNAAGAVYVFKPPFKTTSTYTAKLTASDGVTGDGFGEAVAISPSPQDTIVVGAPFSNNYEGAAYTFAKPGAGFKTTSAYTAKLTAFDGRSQDVLGYSVAIASHVIVLGAPGSPDPSNISYKGSAVTFPNPTTVSTPFYTRRISDPASVPGDAVGWSVAGLGYAAVFGSPYTDATKGAAYIYEQSGTNSNATYSAKFTAPDGVAGDFFGNSVSADGASTDLTATTIAVGAPFHPTTAGGVLEGEAYIYTRPATGTWVSTGVSKAIITSSDTVSGDGFAFSVSLNNGVLGVGAPGFNNNTGKGYVYTKPPAGWTTTTIPTAILHSSPGSQGEQFGWSISVSTTSGILAGAPYQFTQTAPGLAYFLQ